MARSLKKGPFVDVNLQEKVEELRSQNQKKVIKTWARASMISPQYVGSKQTADCWRFLQLSKGRWVPRTNGYLCNGVSSSK